MQQTVTASQREAPRDRVGPLPISYILPIRWDNDDALPELTAYLRGLAPMIDTLIVVDGSPPELFARHKEDWGQFLIHLRPDPSEGCSNGKVAGVLTGVRRATCESLVIADDDVRWSHDELVRGAQLASEVDLVVPQNVFSPLPWHALWDSARTVLNRSVSHDYPGTLIVRRSSLEAAGGYRGDVLFENLELMRTIRAMGGAVRQAPNLYVSRRPPTTQRFWSQRVRQAYDDFAQPLRAATNLSVLPLAGLLLSTGRTLLLLAMLAALISLAEIGRQRHDGARYWPPAVSFVAPLWFFERSIGIWIAYVQLLSGGARYGGSRIPMAAHSTKSLRRWVARDETRDDDTRRLQRKISHRDRRWVGYRPSLRHDAR